MNYEENVTVKMSAAMREYLNGLKGTLSEVYRDPAKKAEMAESAENDPRLDNNIFPFLFKEPQTDQNLPTAEDLVILGRLNLIALRAILRNSIKEDNAKLLMIESEIIQSNELSTKTQREMCDWDPLEGAHGPKFVCEFCPILHKLHETKTVNPEQTIQLTGPESFFSKQPCLAILHINDDLDASTRHYEFVEGLKSALEETKQHKFQSIHYIKVITRALNDKRTLPDLPVFPDWRSKNYFKQHHVYYEYRPYKQFNFIFHIPTGRNDRIKSALHTPFVVTLEELRVLKQQPEYAKIWAYSNYHAWQVRPSDVEPMLEAIKALRI